MRNANPTTTSPAIAGDQEGMTANGGSNAPLDMTYSTSLWLDHCEHDTLKKIDAIALELNHSREEVAGAWLNQMCQLH
jgi:hypothetical protein